MHPWQFFINHFSGFVDMEAQGVYYLGSTQITFERSGIKLQEETGLPVLRLL